MFYTPDNTIKKCKRPTKNRIFFCQQAGYNYCNKMDSISWLQRRQIRRQTQLFSRNRGKETQHGTDPIRQKQANLAAQTLCAQDLLIIYMLLVYKCHILFFKNSSLQQFMGQCTSTSPRQKNTNNTSSHKALHKIDDFKLLKLVGKGGFSRVWKAQQKKSGKIYALKVMSKAKIIAKKSVKAVLLERMILTQLMEGGCKGTVNMVASFQDDSNLYILMDYLEGKSLRHHLNSSITLSHLKIRTIVYRILKALQELYRYRVVHRDIKPENILLDKTGRPFLTDFGIASYIHDNISDNNSGTLGYMAPEVMRSQNHSFTADYYAIGVMTFQLFFQKRPFDNTNKEQLLRQMGKITVNSESYPELKTIPAQACDFITKLLQRKARTRLGFERGVCELLEHAWFGTSMDYDSSDRIQLNYMKLPLSEPQNNLSILLEEESAESVNTQMNEQKINKMLHRDHVQEMFRNFDSENSITDSPQKRRMSDNMSQMSTPVNFKRTATTFT